MGYVCSAPAGGGHPIVSFPLALAGQGERVKIVDFRGDTMLQQRLLGMGIGLEDEVVVLQRGGDGNILIEKTGSRYAFGSKLSQKIKVIRCSL